MGTKMVVRLFVVLLNLIQLVSFYLICLLELYLHWYCLIYSYLLDLVEILIFDVKRLNLVLAVNE